MIHIDDYDVGDDVEAFCTSCRMDLNHRIVAKKGGEIIRVLCLTCEKEHKYRPPQAEKEAKAATKAASAKTKASRAAASAARKTKVKATRDEAAWVESIGADTGDHARPYAMSESFQEGILIMHSTFGLGRVKKVYHTGKMDVVFRSGTRLLACQKVKLEQT